MRPDAEAAPPAPGRGRCVALLAIVCVALIVRAAGLERVFLDDGTVVFGLGDAWYHVRRAFFGVLHFPSFLAFDPYLNYPDGAWVPYPPLWAQTLAALARLAGGGLAVLERIAAWAPVALGALTVLPIYAMGRRLGSPGVGLAAGALYALLPLAVMYSVVGEADHHAAVGLIGACLLAIQLALLDGAGHGRRATRLFLGLAIARTAMLLTWQGSLLYLGLGELALTAAGSLRADRALLRGQAWSCALTALAILPVLYVSGTQVGGAFSAIELSLLHLVIYVALAGLSALLARALTPDRSIAARWASFLTVAASGAALVLALPGVWEGLLGAVDWLAQDDDYGSRVLEQFPLFGQFGDARHAGAQRLAGLGAYLIPLVPLTGLWLARDPARRPAALLFAAWTALTGFLTLTQLRYGNDWAAAGCVGLALGLQAARVGVQRLAPGRPALATATAVALGVLLLLPSLVRYHVPAAAPTARWLLGQAPPVPDRALLSVPGTLVRFAESVRASTPPTRGLWQSDLRPEYSVLCHPGMGHVIHYVAQRATPADNFGVYIGRKRYLQTLAYFRIGRESRALAAARVLSIRYVVTADFGGPDQPVLLHHLHRHDGTPSDQMPRWERFRLVTEGPLGGRPMAAVASRYAPESEVPYKLFEIVEGAVLEIEAAPGSAVEARLDLESPIGRRFQYRAEEVANAGGLARIRVPYSTQATHPTSALGPYLVIADGRRQRVHVQEAAVREGRTVAIRTTGTGSRVIGGLGTGSPS